MRHQKAGRKLGRDTSHRRAMLRNMVTSLFKHEKIETTDAKAKQLRPVAERIITLAKRGDLHARRQVLSYMQDNGTAHRLFEEIKDRFLNRQGGYVRIIKKGYRKGDGAPVSVIQLLPDESGKKKSRKKRKSSDSAGGAGSKSEKESKVVESAKSEAPKAGPENAKEEEGKTENTDQKTAE